MNFAAKPIWKATETYWIHELRTIFPYGLNDRILNRIGYEFKTDSKHINVEAKFSSLPRKHSHANRGKIQRCSHSFITTFFKWFKSYAEH